jgi:hypothetical protein
VARPGDHSDPGARRGLLRGPAGSRDVPSSSTALFPALFFTVALLVTTAYFLLGGLPLLILQHDTPTTRASCAASSTSTARPRWPPPPVPRRATRWRAGTPLPWAPRRWRWRCWRCAAAFSATLEALGAAIQGGERGAIGRFRRLHAAALGLNLLLLVLIVWALTRLPL